MYTADADQKSHYGVIVAGAGLSGIAAVVQLKRVAGFTDVMCYEREADFGGTWMSNTYPGSCCDIPVSFYSYSFAQKDWGTHTPGQAQLLEYIHEVVEKFQLRNIVLNTSVEEASYADGIWTLRIKDKLTGVERTRTCNLFISAVGGLREPAVPGWAANGHAFQGRVFHTARWDNSTKMSEGDQVVVVGNGCTAAQVVPNILKTGAAVTQVARSRQAHLRYPALIRWTRFPFWFTLLRWVPGLRSLQRMLVYWFLESHFKLTDIKNGAAVREATRKEVVDYVTEAGNPKFRESLLPDFDIAAKRRIFDDDYIPSTNNAKFNLIADDSVVSISGNSVFTANGVEIPNVDYLFPLRVSSHGVDLVRHLTENNAKMYRGTMAAGFENFFVLMGPGTTTGHSSVIFTTECQITMILKLAAPILKQLQSGAALSSPAPSVEVTLDAENEYYQRMHPWSQTNFWWNATFPNKSHFKWIGC
ncbi:hypothetical protein RQP46_008232 [Phenoliferia psychrophenolica]